MKPNILDPKFKYTKAVATNIQDTWRRFGWRPQSEMPLVRSVDERAGNADQKRDRPKI